MAKQDYSKWLMPAILVVIALLFVSNQMAVASLYRAIEPRTIDVSGYSVITTDPDKADMYFGYEVQKTSASDAQQDNTDVINAVRDALVGAGLDREDIETSSYRVEPVRRWDEQERAYEVIGYKATHILKVTTSNLDMVGSYVDAAMGAGANRFDSVTFGLTDEKEAEVRKEVLFKAARNGREKADSIANGLGTFITGIRSSSESYYFAPVPRAEALAGAKVPTEITPGEVRVTATVSVSYDIL